MKFNFINEENVNKMKNSKNLKWFLNWLKNFFIYESKSLKFSIYVLDFH